MDAVVTDWESQPKPPTDPVELTVMADAYAVQAAAAKAEPLIEALRAVSTIEADAVAARLAWAQGRPRDSWRLLRRALVASRTDPWANALLMARVLPLAPAVAEGNADLYADVMEVLGHDLAVSLLRIQREGTRFSLAVSQRKPDCVDALAAIGPWVPWEEYFLRQRASCYELAGDGRLAAARADLEALLADGGMSFGAGIEPPGPQPNVKIDEPMLPPAATSTGPAPATAPGASSAASGVGGAAP
jgi:hypothetical protein